MVKIFLVPYHPNESEVAFFVAEELKKDLEGRGHEIIIAPVPEDLNLYGQAKKALQRMQRKRFNVNGQDMLAFESASMRWERKLAVENKGAFVISVHSTPVIGKMKRRSSKLKVREVVLKPENVFSPSLPEIYLALAPRRVKNLYFLETRAVYVPTTPEVQQNLKVVKWGRFYFLQRAHLKKTLGINYLTPKIIKRIGHLINTKIRTEIGEFRTCRKPQYMPPQKKVSQRKRGFLLPMPKR